MSQAQFRKKFFFEKASPPRKSLFLVLFHMLPSILAYFAQIIGKISGKMAKILIFCPLGGIELNVARNIFFGSFLRIFVIGPYRRYSRLQNTECWLDDDEFAIFKLELSLTRE